MRIPREPSHSSNCTTPISSSYDLVYEAWLTDYYQKLYEDESKKFYVDKKTAACEETRTHFRKSPALTLFEENTMRESTKYYGIADARRHWPLLKTFKEHLLFPSPHPNLNVTSRYGRYLASVHSSYGIPEIYHKRRLSQMFKLIIRANIFSYQFRKVILGDNFASLSWFDAVSKRAVIAAVCQMLRNQQHLEIVSFENARLQRLEGIVLLCALSRNGGDNVKELHMWQMFGHGQCPVLKNYSSLGGTISNCPQSVLNGLKTYNKSCNQKLRNVNLNYHFLEILNNFSRLTHLSVNYAYVANQNGDALLCLRAIFCSSLQQLRLLCLPEEKPLLTDPGLGVGGFKITDGVWKRAREWNSKMRVMIVFLSMPQYENIILFLSENIPLYSFYVSSGVDLQFNNPWEIDTTLLVLKNWYSSTLDTLCLHLWHHRDLLDYVIEYRILDEFPNLLNFEFIGVLKCSNTLEGFCKRLLTGKYKLKNLLFWVEESYSNSKERKETIEKVALIRNNYYKKLKNLCIDAWIKTYIV